MRAQLESATADVLTILRKWRRRPLPIVGTVLTLATAVGVNLAMFGLVDRALLGSPGHVAAPERVYTLGFSPHNGSASAALMTTVPYPTFTAIRDLIRPAGQAGAFQRISTHLDLDGDQRVVNAMLVSGSYFDVLGTRPFVGQGLGAADDHDGAAPALLISHAFWRSALSGDPEIVGRSLMVGGLEYRVTGVMPEGFSGHSTSRVDVWMPFAAALRDTPGWSENAFRNMAGVVVRLAPGQTTVAVGDHIAHRLSQGVSTHALVGSEVTASDARTAWWLYGVSFLVLLMGLANSATLLVVRGAQNRPDVAIRTAMGASWRQLVRLALLESMTLSAIATIVSMSFASWIDEAVRKTLFPNVIGVISSQGQSPGPALLAGLATAIVAALAAISQFPKGAHALHPGHAVSGGRKPRLANALLIVQTALSVLLLASAGLVASSLRNLWAQDFGMRLDDVLVVDFEQTSAEIPGQDQLFANALERLKGLPGVELITPIDAIPFSGFNVPPISVPGLAKPPGADRQLPYLTASTPAFLKILGIQVTAGRPLTDEDERAAPVVLVNESFARTAWPGQSALGKCIRIGFDPDFNPETFDPSNGPPVPSDAVACREVVGVTRDVRQRSVLPLDGEDRLMQYFVPFSQVPKPPFVANPTRIRGLLLKTSADGASLAPQVRRLTLSGRTDLPYLRVRRYSDLLERQMRPWVAGTNLLALFSGLALGVAAIGLYAAFAHAITSRQREMAIRVAVGARPAAVRSLVVREALTLAAIGALAGAFGAIAAGRTAGSLLFGTTATDPLVLGSAAALMLAVAAGAALLPAHRASRSDPSVLLRSE